MLPRNKLLLALPQEDLVRLRPLFEEIPITQEQVLHHASRPIEHVYFVEEGLISVVANTSWEGHGVEAWLIGCEGMAGVPVILGTETSPHQRTVQVEGMALRMKASDLRQTMGEIPAFRTILLRYVSSVLVQTSQSGACNVQHSAQTRLVRWLLMAHDRLESDALPLTHDVIAKMIGVRRATVTGMIKEIEATGSILAERGHIQVLDRPELEALACHSYFVVKTEFDRILSTPVVPPDS